MEGRMKENTVTRQMTARHAAKTIAQLFENHLNTEMPFFYFKQEI